MLLAEAIRRMIDTVLDRSAPDLEDFRGLPIAITQEFCSLGIPAFERTCRLHGTHGKLKISAWASSKQRLLLRSHFSRRRQAVAYDELELSADQ